MEFLISDYDNFEIRMTFPATSLFQVIKLQMISRSMCENKTVFRFGDFNTLIAYEFCELNQLINFYKLTKLFQIVVGFLI